ncbi:MAG TPA: DUF1549 domain-containing protein [Planctomycetaceae bacterium]|nr:DUF1549 domain-containing protein [Planctomycetaceae bacterium]
MRSESRKFVFCCAVALLGILQSPSVWGQNLATGSNEVLINDINKYIRQGWEDNEVKPSPQATDAEWCRRVYLDIVGHIPPVDELQEFLKDSDPAKRSKLIAKLIDHPDYIRNWTTIWTNVSIGRVDDPLISRLGMNKFYREVFAQNRPWNEVVYDVLTAEGHFEQNGAVNFILAQLPEQYDEAVQLTGNFSRLFLGSQVQCTQCHDHPFNKWKQNQFWELNTFFRQVRRMDYEKYDPDSGRMVEDYSEVVWRNIPVGQEVVFYERRDGLVKPAFPIYNGVEIDDDGELNRREELGKLLRADEDKSVARAAVNRMWGHFFGYGFTKPVDDMGPHNPASHPELLERLTDEFVKSGYDMKQLVSWIANSEAYTLTSQFGSGNEIDNPGAGEIPLFSHLYVKSLEAEQLYDSLIIATNAHKAGRANFEMAEAQRQEWMQRFVAAFGTTQDDETTTYNGSIPQALMMMNGELVTNACNCERGSFLHSVVTGPGNDAMKIKTLYLATLSREPSGREISMVENSFRQAGPNGKIAAYQDLMWVLLNSNEFIVNH